MIGWETGKRLDMSLRRIFIIDVDPSAALVTQHGLQMLLGSDAEVSIAASADEALQYCKKGLVDLLIVDPRPHLPMIALLQALQAELPDLPVLVLTAYDTPRLRAQMRAYGVRHYLAKPVDLHDLRQMVHDMLVKISSANGHTVTPAPTDH